MSSVEGGLAEDVIFHHVPDGASSDEGWVKRACLSILLSWLHADVLCSMTVYMIR